MCVVKLNIVAMFEQGQLIIGSQHTRACLNASFMFHLRWMALHSIKFTAILGKYAHIYSLRIWIYMLLTYYMSMSHELLSFVPIVTWGNATDLQWQNHNIAQKSMTNATHQECIMAKMQIDFSHLLNIWFSRQGNHNSDVQNSLARM